MGRGAHVTGQRSVRGELVRLAAVMMLSCSLLVILTAGLAALLTVFGMLRSEAALAGILISVISCPVILMATWRWRYSDQISIRLLAALSIISLLVAIMLSVGPVS